jgi:hypothetical protein
MWFQIIPVYLEDRASKKPKHSIAEQSRPARELKEHIRHRDRKRQGRKRVHEPKDATYTNWHQPFLWSQIVDAAKDPAVGRSMSATAIRNVLIKKNPTTFARIARTTINGWIDHSKTPPQWSDAALQMAEDGNRPSSEGGRAGVLVCQIPNYMCLH